MESIPYDKRSGKIWFNGKTVDWKDANIHILNHGLHYASCVFEGERVTMKFLDLRNILLDYFILLKGWVLKFPIVNLKLMKLAKI